MNFAAPHRAIAAIATAVVIVCGMGIPQMASVQAAKPTVVVGARGFTEEAIAGYLYADLLSHHHIPTSISTGIGSEATAIKELETNSIDLLPDYLGNGLEVDLHKQYKAGTTPKAVYGIVKKGFAPKHITWLSPAYKFNDQNVFVTTKANSTKFGLHSLTDLARLAPKLHFAILTECVNRLDCLAGFDEIYKPHQSFKELTTSESGTSLTNPPYYDDLVNKTPEGNPSTPIQVAQGYGTTDSPIAHFGLVALSDPKHEFPPDQFSPVIRNPILKDYPAISTLLAKLDADITTSNFRSMNAQVDFGGQPPQLVADNFLHAHHLI